MASPNPILANRLSVAERNREIAEILVGGLMRLRARKSGPKSADFGESSLAFSGHQSGHADPNSRETTRCPHLTRVAALKTTPTPDLKAMWRQLFETEPPPYNRRFLESRLAYRIQELAHGGLKPETIERLEAISEDLDGDNPGKRSRRSSGRPIAGTRLIREWRRVEHCVTVATTATSTRAARINRCPPSPGRSPARAGTRGYSLA